MNLLGRYLEAMAAVEEAAAMDWAGEWFDAAIAEEVQTEEAIIQFVKMANRQPLSAPAKQPIAAVLDGALVVVAPTPENPGLDMVLVVQPRNIAWGE
jgi:hypothetical protein